MKKMICLSLLATLFGVANAQTVWRCGPDGRTYADEPCKGGRVVDVADTRTAEQVESARRVAASQTQLARQLEQERLLRERELRAGPIAAAGIRPSAVDGVRTVRERPLLGPPKHQRRLPAGERTSPSNARAFLRAQG